MKKRMITLFVIALVLLGCSPIIGIAGASYQSPGSAGPSTLTGAPAAVNVSVYEDQKESLSPWEKKISANLLPEETPAVSSGTLALTGRGDNMAYVYVSVDPTVSTHVIDSTVSEVTDRDESNHIAVAKVPLTGLEPLASRSDVRSIQQVIPPRVRTGSVTAESDTILRTNLVRSLYGKTGTGVKVGVISDGVSNYASAVSSGDLPTVASGNLNLLSTGAGNEGTAMLEIIYDEAPGAKLYFHDMGSNKLQFIHAIDHLVSSGCTVIVDDVGWYDEPYFQDGMIARYINKLISEKNIIYVSSAGNDCINHYQGMFVEQGSGMHDFSAGTAPVYKSLYAWIPSGGSIVVILQWDDRFDASENDYDLYLSHLGGGDVAGSWDVQGGGSSNPPFEALSYQNTGSGDDFQIDVFLWSGTDKILEVYTLTDNGAAMYSNNIVCQDSVFGHPAVPGVLAAGAIEASDPGNDEIEYFSSQGPSTIVYPEVQTRFKPDVAGIDGVHITGAGGFPNPFYGTSASAPTVAAAAADLWSAFPAKTGQDIANKLRITAVDLGTGGPDYTFGFGRVDAVNSYTTTLGTGTIMVSSNPSGATLYVDGINKGTTPKTVTNVDVGMHKLWLNKTNFRDDYFTIVLYNGASDTYVRTLTAVAGTTTSGGTEILGNTQNAEFSLYVDPMRGWSNMVFGDNTLQLHLEPRVSRGVSFAVSAGDKLDGGKSSSTKGKMAEYRYTTSWVPIGWASPGKVFSKPLRLSQTLVSPEYQMTGTTDPIIFTDVGQGMATPVSRDIYAKQEVTVSDRPVSAAGENRVYKIPITFTLTAL